MSGLQDISHHWKSSGDSVLTIKLTRRVFWRLTCVLLFQINSRDICTLFWGLGIVSGWLGGRSSLLRENKVISFVSYKMEWAQNRSMIAYIWYIQAYLRVREDLLQRPRDKWRAINGDYLRKISDANTYSALAEGQTKVAGTHLKIIWTCKYDSSGNRTGNWNWWLIRRMI